MRDNAEQIRALIEGRAEAVHEGRIDGVDADHAEDVVMFDVPPPYRGVRGADAYRKVWPTFDIEEPEAAPGADIALAFELVRCGTENELKLSETRHRLPRASGSQAYEGFTACRAAHRVCDAA
ncbi:DUF4440 domain-containing protein [Streptomyces sp. CS090A]|uniref:YybH family protein n=1 Tax=Streptomyces sp. CS090A TaxID=2162710 RepID=UPI001EF7368C|nr:DUF4440 domain-containing protein [Streptomyces sp. CS090A]